MIKVYYAIFLLTAATLFWSGNTIVIRALVGEILPLSFAFWRWVCTLMIILPFSWKCLIQDRFLIIQQWKLLLFLALSGVSFFNIFLYLGVQTTTAINISLIFSIFPMITIVLAYYLLGERFSWIQSIGIILSFIGLLYVISSGSLSSFLNLQWNSGDMFILLSQLLWALYSIYIRKYPLRLHPLSLLAVLSILGTPFLLPFYLWEIHTIGNVNWNLEVFLGVVYAGIFPSVLAYLFWNKGIEITGAGFASLSIYLTPLFTVILAMIFLDESVEGYHYIGGSIILIGLIFCGWKQKAIHN